MFPNQLEFSPTNETEKNFKFDYNEKEVQKSSNELFQNILAAKYVNKHQKLNYATQYDNDISKQLNPYPLVYNGENYPNKKPLKKSLQLNKNKFKKPLTAKPKNQNKKAFEDLDIEGHWNNDNRVGGLFDSKLKGNELGVVRPTSSIIKKEKSDLMKTFNQNSFNSMKKGEIHNKLYQRK